MLKKVWRLRICPDRRAHKKFRFCAYQPQARRAALTQSHPLSPPICRAWIAPDTVLGGGLRHGRPVRVFDEQRIAAHAQNNSADFSMAMTEGRVRGGIGITGAVVVGRAAAGSQFIRFPHDERVLPEIS